MRITSLIGAAFFAMATAFVTVSGSTQVAEPAPLTSQSAGAQGQSHSVALLSVSQRLGTFAGLNGKHVAGTATVSDSQVVLSGFSSDAGPDLHIYLTNGTDEKAVSAGKELSTVAYGNASQTFSTDGVDPSTYTTVVIHCDKAKAVFGAATLT